MPPHRVLLFEQLRSCVTRRHGKGYEGAVPRPEWLPFARGDKGLCPTLPRSGNYHGLYSRPGDRTPRYLSVAQELEMFDVASESAQARDLWEWAEKAPLAAHTATCQGWSARVSASIFAALRRRGAMRGVGGVVRVAVAYAGADLATAGLRPAGVKYDVVYASERSAVLRRMLARRHPGATVVKDAAATDHTFRGMPPIDLWLCGFPCNVYSQLHRGAHEGSHRVKVHRALRELRAALGYVRVHKPKVVVMENVPTLLCKHLDYAMDKICAMLQEAGGSGYTWYLPQTKMCVTACAPGTIRTNEAAAATLWDGRAHRGE